MKLFDRRGNPVEVPDEHAHEALASGQYGAPAGTQIPVRMDGKIGSVPVEKLSTALEGGAQVVSQKEYEQADLQAKYGDAGHQAEAFGASALDAATLGTSNAVIGGIGGKKVRESLRKSEEANPVASGVGTAAGIIAPVVADVFSGGAVTPEIAAFAGEKAVASAAAKAGEGALARAGERALLGAGEKAAAEEVARAAPAVERSTALARAPRVIEGTLEDAPRGLPGRGAEMAGEVVQPARGALPAAETSEALAPRPFSYEAPPPRAQAPIADAAFEDLPREPYTSAAEKAAYDSWPGGATREPPPTFAQTFAPDAQRVEAKAAETVAQKIAEATPVPVEVAEGAAKVAVTDAEPTARAYGKGVVRQVVENSLLGPQRLVSGGGKIVEDIVSDIVGREAETAIGRIAQKAVATAARGAFEGGAYGVGNEIGHQFLQDDPELNGERLASAWFHGALLGGAMGGGLGTLGAGSKEALARVVGKDGIASYLTDKAGEHMWHAAGPTKKMTQQAERYAGGVAKVGNLIREDAIALMGETPKNREQMLELAGMMKAKHAAALDAVLDHLDQTGKADQPRLGEILDVIDGTIKDLKKSASPTGQLESFRKRIIDALDAHDPLTNAVNENVRVPFKQLRDFRATVDDTMARFNTAPGADTVTQAAGKEVRSKLESFLEKRVDETGNKLAETAGGRLLKDYKAAKEGYQAAKLLEKAASSGVAAEKTNQFLSLTDKLLSIPGAMVGHAVAGPIGAIAAEIATANASKFIRKNFDFVVSDALAKLANVSRNEHVLNAAQKTNERVQKRVDQGLNAVKKGLEGKEIPAPPPTGGPKTYEERRTILLNLAAQHEAVVGHLQSITSPLDQAAPEHAANLMSASIRTLTYLLGVLPKPPQSSSLTPQVDLKNYNPPDSEKYAFNRQFDMAVHPANALALVASGAYTVQHDQALTATSPKMKADGGAKLRAALDRATKPVPPKMQYSLSVYLGKPAIPPDLGRQYQANLARPAKPPAPPKPLKLPDTTSLNKPGF